MIETANMMVTMITIAIAITGAILGTGFLMTVIGDLMKIADETFWKRQSFQPVIEEEDIEEDILDYRVAESHQFVFGAYARQRAQERIQEQIEEQHRLFLEVNEAMDDLLDEEEAWRPTPLLRLSLPVLEECLGYHLQEDVSLKDAAALLGALARPVPPRPRCTRQELFGAPEPQFV